MNIMYAAGGVVVLIAIVAVAMPFQNPGGNVVLPGRISQTHLECISNTCTIVSGNGTNQCSPAGAPCGVYCGNSICDGAENFTTCPQDCPSYLKCVSSTCTQVAGSGTDECSPAGSACGNQTNLTAGVGNQSGNQTNQSGTNGTAGVKMPDLKITAITYQAVAGGASSNNTNGSNTSNGSSYYTVTITATVANAGDANAGASTTRIALTSSYQQNVQAPQLAAGQSATVSKIFYLVKPGSYTINVTADLSNNVKESNENNNILGTTITI